MSDWMPSNIFKSLLLQLFFWFSRNLAHMIYLCDVPKKLWNRFLKFWLKNFWQIFNILNNSRQASSTFYFLLFEWIQLFVLVQSIAWKDLGLQNDPFCVKYEVEPYSLSHWVIYMY